MNNKTILTDKEVDILCETLKANSTDEDKMFMNVLNDEIPKSEENIETIKEDGYKMINENGEEIIIGDKLDNINISDKPISEVVSNEAIDINKIKDFGLGLTEDEDLKCIYNLMMRVKNKESFSVYNAMTPNLQLMAKKMSVESQGLISPQIAAKDLIKYILDSLLMDQTFVDTIDAINAELSKTFNYADVATEELHEKINKFLEKADEIEKENPNKAKLYRDIVNSYNDSYELKYVKNVFKTNGFIRKKLKKWADNNYNRIVSDFNYKYKDSKFIIKNINLVYNTLSNILDKSIDRKYIKQFVILIAKAYQNLSPDNISEHILMYYTITNITGLSFSTDNENIKQRRENIKNNIIEIINDIIKVEEGVYNA